MSDRPGTTDLLARLRLRARYPDNGRVDDVPAALDWHHAADEIERLRGVIAEMKAHDMREMLRGRRPV